MHVREVEQVVEVVRVRYPASESSIGEERESSRWGEIEREGVTSESLKLAGGDARESIGLCSVCVVSVRGASGGREIEITWRTISKSSLSHFGLRNGFNSRDRDHRNVQNDIKTCDVDSM